MNIYFPGKFIFLNLKVFKAKNFVERAFKRPKRSKSFSFPGRLKKGMLVEQFHINNRKIISFIPNNKKSVKHIFFLHGGGFVLEAFSGHWWLIGQLIQKYAFSVSFVDYPLAPEFTYKESQSMVLRAYLRLKKNYPKDSFCFLGDSSGGGLCLTLAQKIRSTNKEKLPDKIALLSPWVDISLQTPEIKHFEKKDLLLSRKSLLICSHYYAPDIDFQNSKVSPIYGEMHDLKSIGIFVAGNEIFLPDCRKLKQKIERTNTKIFYKEYQRMQHDWIVLPIKERIVLLEDVVKYLEK